MQFVREHLTHVQALLLQDQEVVLLEECGVHGAGPTEQFLKEFRQHLQATVCHLARRSLGVALWVSKPEPSTLEGTFARPLSWYVLLFVLSMC